MSDLIVMHWGSDAISAMLPPKGGRFEFPEAGFDSDEAAGRWLKDQLRGAGIGGRRAAIVLPRQAVVLRTLTLPDVPDDELPDLVRMQAATKSSMPLNKVRLDFVPLPGSAEGRSVLLATATATMIESIAARVKAAGFEPVAIGVAPFGTAAQVCDSDEATLIVAVEGTRAEITLCRDGVVWFSHGTDLSGDDAEEDRRWLASEISRTIIAADHHSSDAGIARVVLIGREGLLGAMVAPLEERYGCGAETIFTGSALGVENGHDIEPAIWAAMLGQGKTRHVPRIDFLNPRKRVERPDRTRLIRGLLVGGVAAALLMAYLSTWWQQRGIEQQIEALQSERAEIESALAEGEPILEKHGNIEEWMNKEAVWTNEWMAFGEAMTGTDRLFLTEMSLQPGGRETWGVMTGAGRARTDGDVAAFAASMESAGYRVEPPVATSGENDKEYPQEFEFEITVPKPAAEAS